MKSAIVNVGVDAIYFDSLWAAWRNRFSQISERVLIGGEHYSKKTRLSKFSSLPIKAVSIFIIIESPISTIESI